MRLKDVLKLVWRLYLGYQTSKWTPKHLLYVIQIFSILIFFSEHSYFDMPWAITLSRVHLYLPGVHRQIPALFPDIPLYTPISVICFFSVFYLGSFYNMLMVGGGSIFPLSSYEHSSFQPTLGSAFCSMDWWWWSSSSVTMKNVFLSLY